MKKRILICGEAHYAAAGFAKMSKEFCSRLHNAGYEVAELSNGGHTNQVDRNVCKWNFYGVLPDPFEQKEYDSNFHNIWGAWRFEEVVLDFKPDYVFTYLDHWNCSHIFNSPLRRFFKLGYLACIDSEPVKLDWLNQMEDADDVFHYTDWASEVANNQYHGLNNRGSLSPGADFSIYKVHPDRKKHREMAGLDPNWLIAGMIARNQKRKLFPDLFAGFRAMIDKYGKSHKELIDRAKLYIHTSQPDQGYHIPYLIKEYGLANRVLFSYICRSCKNVFVSHFRGERTVCLKCRQPAAFSPRVEFGVPEDTLSDIINLFDVYLQICTNEGMGLPQIEAAACGIPVMSTNYSAPEDILKKLNGYPLNVLQLFKEVETQAYKAVPDNNDMADKLFEFFSLPEVERKKRGLQSKLGALKHYNYDKNIKKLMQCIDDTNLASDRWNSPSQLFVPNTQLPEFRTGYDLVGWCISNILGRKELINSAFHKKLVNYMNSGYRYNGSGTNFYNNDCSIIGLRQSIEDINIEKLVNEMVSIRNNWNHWELRRTGQLQVPRKPYLDRAKPNE